MKVTQWKLNSIIGPLYLVASETGLRGVYWKQQSISIAESLEGPQSEKKILIKTIEELSEYFEGKRQVFSIALEPEGTEFQKLVWGELTKIPYGKTLSYSDIAIKLKNDKAVRAVGSANGKNPLSIIVPCHRVIAADGTLGGYAGGLQIKAQLLDLEKKITDRFKI